MSLESLIRDQLASNETLAGKLSKYNGAPAIFFGIAPDDTEPDWFKNQYPRIAYTITKQADNKRNTAGAMTMRVYCDSAGTHPEEIVSLLKETMRYLVLTPEEQTSAFIFGWNRTDAFEVPKAEGRGDKGERVLMDQVLFDIYEYSDQTSSDPDPVDAVNRFIKRIVPTALVYGLDTFEPRFTASDEKPLIYCRLNAEECSQQIYSIAFMNAMISVHILCPTAAVRLKYTISIQQEMQLVSRIWMSDHSPMMVNRVASNFIADPIVTGQVATVLQYTLPRHVAHGTPLINIHRDLNT